MILTRHPATDRSQPPRAGGLLCMPFRPLVGGDLAVAGVVYNSLATVGRRLAETRGVVDGENAERTSDGISADQGDGCLQVLSAAERMFAEFVILAVSDSRRFARDSREIDSCFMSSC
jgi:hypothetical protein